MRNVLSVAVVIMLQSAAVARVAEKLDRGLVALPQADGGVYISWRFVASDPADTAFHVYRSNGSGDSAQCLTSGEPLGESTNFVDAKPPQGELRYFVRPATLAAIGAVHTDALNSAVRHHLAD